jgi:methionyl-tRNA formyltransferase
MGAGHEAPGLVFMGTPEFAATILAALIDAREKILAVYTQPPRPKGRGHRVQSSPVQQLAERSGLAVRSPSSLRSAEAAAEFAALEPAGAVVAAYGLILPRTMLEIPRLGCLNVHASLLPRWRGAAPIERAILEGDALTGITIMQMEEGLDSGPILLQQSLAIGPEATAGSLTAELARLGARLILEALDRARRGQLEPHPQPQEGVTYARKIGREEGRLDWRHEAGSLERRVRAFTPAPGAFFEAMGERIRVLSATPLPGTSGMPPGTLLDDRLTVACGEGALRLLQVQRAGRAPLDAALFLRGFRIPKGSVLPCPATS